MPSSVNLGLLVLRIGFGIVFVLHGWPKIAGGPQVWSQLGMAMQNVGIAFAPAFWGFLAACSEFVGGLCLIAGFCTRLAAAFMAITMLVAILMHLHHGDPFLVFSHPLKAAIVFLSLVFLGAGERSVDHALQQRRNR